MMQIFPWPVTPTITALRLQENDDALEAIFPLTKDKIVSIGASQVEADGFKFDRDYIDIDDIRDALGGEEGGFALTDLHHTHEFRPLYKDANNLWIDAGQTLHRGLFKRQPLEEDTQIPRSLNAASALDTTCPPSNPGDSGLDKGTWHFVYCDTDAASGEEGPRIKISPTPPENRTGHGWEHPTNTKWAYLGPFRTDDTAAAAIIPFMRHEDWYYWADAKHGPAKDGSDTPDPNLIESGASSDFITIDVGDWLPVTARAAVLTNDPGSGKVMRVRAKGELGWYSLEDEAENAHLVVPVRQYDASGNLTGTEFEIDHGSDEGIGIVGFHEIQR